ncbi:thymidylate synthase [Candidatus Woesearchaeota archaeon]|nr:thymidylate synthase [Candidatus Woesearchaeota archaeon]
MREYVRLIELALSGERSSMDRTGAGTVGVFQQQARFDLSQGFPLVTTKKTYWRGVAEEAVWFLQGNDNIRSLLQKRVRIWSLDALRHNLKHVIAAGVTSDEEVKKAKQAANDARKVLYDESIESKDRIEQFNSLMILPNDIQDRFEKRILEDAEFAQVAGCLGPVYGPQWRGRGGALARDQIKELEDALRSGGTSRRMIVSAWNSAQLDAMALPPCHMFWQVHIAPESKMLHLGWYQRSCDTILGIPFNIASYALIASLLAATHGYEIGTLTGSFGDLHIYIPHIPAAKEQFKREPLPLPQLRILNKKESITEYTTEDFKLCNYESHPALENPTPMFGGLF